MPNKRSYHEAAQLTDAQQRRKVRDDHFRACQPAPGKSLVGNMSGHMTSLANSKLVYANRGLSDLDDLVASLSDAEQDYDEINLSQNRLSSHGIAQLVRICRRCNNLRVLKLYKNNLDDDCAHDLAELLKYCQTLQEVHLSHNRFSRWGAALLVEAASRSRPKACFPLWLRLEQNSINDPASFLCDMEERFAVCPRRPDCTSFRCCVSSRVHLVNLDPARERCEKKTGDWSRLLLRPASPERRVVSKDKSPFSHRRFKSDAASSDSRQTSRHPRRQLRRMNERARRRHPHRQPKFTTKQSLTKRHSTCRARTHRRSPKRSGSHGHQRKRRRHVVDDSRDSCGDLSHSRSQSCFVEDPEPQPVRTSLQPIVDGQVSDDMPSIQQPSYERRTSLQPIVDGQVSDDMPSIQQPLFDSLTHTALVPLKAEPSFRVDVSEARVVASEADSVQSSICRERLADELDPPPRLQDHPFALACQASEELSSLQQRVDSLVAQLSV